MVTMRRRAAIAIPIVAILTAMVPVSVPAQDYETLLVTLPKGDQQAGRRAFVDLKCFLCHRVDGDARFPAPLPESQGPELNRSLRARPVAELTSAIVVPSHSMSVKTSPAIKKRLETSMQSPMADFSTAMTVRQLADLVAYLRSVDR